ncbi:MAG: thiamine phosphate synthase [Chloroflexi bacterium]|nr:thiamine phosphate synthase [Chloroflexota bacterium]
MLVTDRALVGGGDGLVEVVAAAVEGGANAVQLREKDLAPTNLARLAGQLGEALRERSASGQRALLIVNGSADVAREIGADGLHLPADAPFARPDGITLVGRSVHSVEEAVKAEREGADYLIAGPIYQTRSHGGAAPAGLRLISAVVAVVSVPVVAIGGITAARLPDVLSAGAGGVAVISAILGASSPAAAASALREALEGVPLRARRAAVER